VQSPTILIKYRSLIDGAFAPIFLQFSQGYYEEFESELVSVFESMVLQAKKVSEVQEAWIPGLEWVVRRD